MATRNFDASSITQRERDRVLAQNLYQSQINGTPIYRNKNRGTISEQIMDYHTGTETTYTTSDVGFMVENVGGVGNYFAPNLISPMPPTNLTYVITLGDTTGQATISFYPGQTDPYPIIGYGYSINNGQTFSLFDPPQMDTPVVISDLIIGQTYYIGLKVMTTLQWSPSSIIIPVLVALPPDAPVITTIDPGNQQLSVSFTQGLNGGSPITNYQYSTDNGVTYVSCSPAFTTSPLIITTLSDDPTTRLSNDVSYSILIKAVNAAGVSVESNMISGSTYTLPLPPVNLISVPGNGSVQIEFFEILDTSTGPITNYQYSIDDGATFVPFNPPQISSPVTITGLTNNESYLVQLKAVNVVGISNPSESVSAAPFRFPDPPTLTSSTPGNYMVSVYFTEGDNGGTPVIDHMYSIDNGVTFQMCCPAQPLSPVYITGLMNNTTYQVVLKSVTIAGISVPSNMISAPTFYRPDPPTNLSFTEGNKQISVSFTAGNNGGTPITNYRYSIDNGVSYTLCFPIVTASPVVIKNLVNNTTYQIKLKAINLVGMSDPSAMISANTVNSSQPPTLLSATPGNEQITVAFTPGLNTLPVTNYQYSLNGAAYIELSPPSTVSPITIKKLANRTTYVIRLKTMTANDTSLPSGSIQSYTLNPPQPPTGLSAVSGSTSITISFTPGADGGSPITNYLYSLNGGAYTACNPVATTSPATINNLVSNRTYNITLQALNEIGASISSANIIANTFGNPSAPTNLSGSISSNQAIVSFTPGSNGGYPITNYMYSLNSSSFIPFSPAVTTSPVTIPNVTLASNVIILRAVTSFGQSVSSDGLTIIKNSTASAPTLTSIASGVLSIIVNFTAPTSTGGSIITNYKCSVNGSAGYVLNTIRSPVTITTTNGTIPLTSGTTYAIKLSAVTALGDGDLSNELSTYTYAAGSPPTISSVSVNATTLTIVYVATAQGPYVAPITSYLYSIDNGVSYRTATASPISVVGTYVSGTTYSVRMKAVNVVGQSVPTAEYQASFSNATLKGTIKMEISNLSKPLNVYRTDQFILGRFASAGNITRWAGDGWVMTGNDWLYNPGTDLVTFTIGIYDSTGTTLRTGTLWSGSMPKPRILHKNAPCDLVDFLYRGGSRTRPITIAISAGDIVRLTINPSMQPYVVNQFTVNYTFG
jgi:titin